MKRKESMINIVQINMEERLQKYLAECGIASRRKCEEYIIQGKVQVNGKKITELGVKVNPEKDKITFEGKNVKQEERKVYILLNKPIGYVTTSDEQFGRDKVLDLVKVRERVVPVGRLDMYTSGALILTNDGDFVYKVTHPKHEITKTYTVTVKGIIKNEEVEQLRKGVKIDEYTTRPAKVKILKTDEEKEKNDKEALISRLQDEAMKVYHKKEKDFNEFAKVNVPEEGVELGEEDAAIFNDGIREVERVILLKVIDSKWMNHIDDMDQLRIGLQSYAQKDPVVQYKFLGYDMFEEMTKNIRHDTVGALMHVQIEQKVERKQVARATGTNKDELVERGPYRRKEAKIGRNAPCPCGSGKKYKNCCGRFAN